MGCRKMTCSVCANRERLAGVLRSERGQMSVELAVLVPVIIVVALVGYNLMCFVELCSAFDHIALDSIISQGVSPTGELGTQAACEAVRSCTVEALGSTRCYVEVRASFASEGEGGEGVSFVISPLLTRYTCTLIYHPWPGSFSMGSLVYESPVVLTHERTLVVDRFRPGVVV